MPSRRAPALRLVEPETVATAGRVPGDLPSPLTSFIGREDELASLQALLLDPDVRLVTLTGPGGVGKTRLAIRLAELLRGSFEDGVRFVDMASVRDPALVPGWIARRLELRPATAGGSDVMLKDFLHGRRILLVLDNFEHLLRASPFIAGLLEGSAGLKLLVTSRAALHVYGEHRWRVQPLATHATTRQPLPAITAHIPAVRLFVDRAAAADEAFELTAENAATVAEICQRLEGLPLAIELAAARIAVLSPLALLKRLEPRLPVLTGGLHGQPERFRTMRSAIGWSYDLLSTADQSLFCRLAVFVGGFAIEAAQSVAGDARTVPGESDAPMLDRLCTLVDQSLLQSERVDDDIRFSMLEIMREFGLEVLGGRDELEETKRRHAAYYLGLGKALVPGLSGAEMVSSLARLETELPNIRAALSWALDRRQVETALRLAADLYPFWNYRGHLAEGRTWLTAALEHGGAQPRTRIDGLLAACGLAALQGDYDAASELVSEAVPLAEREAYPFGIARAQLLRGLVTEWTGNYRAAASIYAECLRHSDDLGAQHWRSRILALHSEADAMLGDVTSAERRAQTALQEAMEAGHAWNAGAATGVLAYLRLMQGAVDEAARRYGENLHRYRELGDHRGMGGAIAGFAGVALHMDRKTTAARLLGAARATGDEIGVAHLGNKGLVERIDVSVRAAMSPAAFQAAWDAGYALSREWAFSEVESITFEVLKHRVSRPPDVLEGAGLTRREGEVVYLLARRLTDKEIADALSISPRTAMNHVGHVIAKLGLGNRREVAQWARQHGLV